MEKVEPESADLKKNKQTNFFAINDRKVNQLYWCITYPSFTELLNGYLHVGGIIANTHTSRPLVSDFFCAGSGAWLFHVLILSGKDEKAEQKAMRKANEEKNKDV